jgi:hypothetical protein
LKMKCVGCGVIESIRRIEVDEVVTARCTIDETDQAPSPGRLLDGTHRATAMPVDSMPVIRHERRQKDEAHGRL